MPLGKWNWFCITLCYSLLLASSAAWGGTFPATSDPTLAAQQRWGMAMEGYMAEGCVHGASATTSVVLASCRAFVVETTTDAAMLKGFEETQARTITYSAGDGTYWLAGRQNPGTTPVGWTCGAGTHYCWIRSATHPATPSGMGLLTRAEVTGGAITAVQPVGVMTPMDPGRWDHSEYLVVHGGVCDGTTDVWPALMAAHDALPANGGRIILPANTETTACMLAQTFTPTKPVHLVGQGAWIVNGNNRNQSHLFYTGAGVGIALTGAEVTNSILEGFMLRNTGTGTVGVEVNVGGVTLRRLNMFGGTPWSIAGVRAGQTANSTNFTMRDTYIRGVAPICVHLVSISAHAVLDHNVIRSCTDSQLELGATGFAVQNLYAHGNTFEGGGVGVGVRIIRVQGATFVGNYFEPRASDIGAIQVPSSAIRADGLVFIGNWFGFTIETTHAVTFNFLETYATFIGNHFIGDLNGAVAMVRNLSARALESRGNFMVGGAVPMFLSPLAVYAGPDFRRGAGAVSGFPVDRLCTNSTAVGNVDAAQTDMKTCTIPASTLWANTMAIRFLVHGQTATNANVKRVRVYLQGTLLLDTTALAASNLDWVIEGECTRHNANEATCYANGRFNGAILPTVAVRQILISVGWDGNMDLLVTGTGIATNDVVADVLRVTRTY